MDRLKPEIETEIVVDGYSRRYVAAFRHLLGIEGGYVDDPADRGGATKYGISLRFLKAEGAFDEDGDGFKDFDLDFDGDIDGQDIRKLSIGDAQYLYHRCFWKLLDCESFPQPIGEMLFDQGVNGGNHAARKLLQRAINLCQAQAGGTLIGVDGVIGTETRKALSWVLSRDYIGMGGLVEAFREVVRDRYREIARRYPSQKKFLRGWLNRADRLGRS
jgi:lysozyme family protein